MGPFFARLAAWLHVQGALVQKVNFNAGDEWFWSEPGCTGHGGEAPTAVAYNQPTAQWPAALRALLDRHRADALVLFGQSRPLHQMAVDVARAAGVPVYVFEEGYLRPDYVTLEVGGVNAESSLPRDATFYRELDIQPAPPPEPTGQQFGTVANLAMTYALACWLGRKRFPHYQHHRCLHPIREGLRWVRGAGRKYESRWVERRAQAYLAAPEQHKRYFLVPLQVHNDAQILCHSPYQSVEQFIHEVIDSFAKAAPADDLLVIKHHPLDKPYRDYRELIRSRVAALGLEGRVLYIHDQHLPTLLRAAKGVVTVNSTTGLQAMFHNTPVLALGDCLYAIPGLVHPGPLHTFWQQPGEVDRELFLNYRAYLTQQTQLNASFYADAPGLSSSTDTSRRAASASDTPAAAAKAADWSAPTVPTLK